MRRRHFIMLFGGTIVAWPFALRAQSDRIHHIGVLVGSVSSPDDPIAKETLRPFRDAMQKAGLIEDRNIQIDYRFGGDPTRINASAADMVALKPELIFAQGLPAALALREKTSTIPLVFTQVADPVHFGLVQSMAHPGGNITGFIVWDLSIGSKWTQLLLQIAPATKSVGIIYNPGTAPYAPPLITSAKAAAGNDVSLVEYPVHSDNEIETAISTLSREPKAALLVIPEPFTAAHRDQIVNQANLSNLPSIVPLVQATKHGALLSYNYSFDAIMSEPVAYIDRILKGQTPAELPVQAPTKFELSINLKTAKALGLTVPTSLLDLADEIVD
jgi:putative tryptophan/tyrosine transport system substrate-binding protein